MASVSIEQVIEKLKLINLTPQIDASTPCTEIQGASLTFNHRIISAINAEVGFPVTKIGTLCSTHMMIG